MRKTYVTRMPDEAGAFLRAGRIAAQEGGNIVRVNYNRAVDTHTLFLEVEATEKQHAAIEKQLTECGYLSAAPENTKILMIVLVLRDEPGAIEPVLEILGRSRVNISYISSASDGSPVQRFKMGLLIENTDDVSTLIGEISQICPIEILDYEVTDRLLDGTVFYVTFANEMRRILGLDQKTTGDVLIAANRMMQQLDEQKKSPLTTFDYIRRFAEAVKGRKGDNFTCRQTLLSPAPDVRLYVFEPPTGSNTYILQRADFAELLFIDSGFACYRDEMLSLFRSLFPDFDERPKTCFITHADVDHVGLLDLFDRTFMVDECCHNFALEKVGENNFRERFAAHAPYCLLSKIIADYRTPDLRKCRTLGGRRGKELFEEIARKEFLGYEFIFVEGSGGHVRGETLIVCPALRLLFTGDIYVNVRGFTEEQKDFNRLAPFLMTGVDVDPALCRREREALAGLYPGYTLCPGHGAVE